jgi:signal-transduction protein with cAMP-binding, CBS, and nucleotidyltransferase domain
MDIAKMLTGHEFFASLLPEQVEKISRFSVSKRLKRGEVVHEYDGKATQIFVLLEGEVELRLPAGSAEPGLLINRVSRGEFFGIAPLLGAKRYTTRGVCAAPSKVLFIEAKPLLALLNANPTIDRQVMAVVARAYFDRYQKLAERIERVLAELASV